MIQKRICFDMLTSFGVLLRFVLHFGTTTVAGCKSFHFNVTCDDFMFVYIDGIPIPNLPNAFGSEQPDTVEVPCTAKVMAVLGINLWGPGAIRGSDESGRILTDQSWKCSNKSYPGWEKVDFNDSNWPYATEVRTLAAYNVPGINTTSRWIWAENYIINTTKYGVAYCRKTLESGAVNPTTVPPDIGTNTSESYNNTLDTRIIVIIILSVILAAAVVVIIILTACLVKQCCINSPKASVDDIKNESTSLEKVPDNWNLPVQSPVSPYESLEPSTDEPYTQIKYE